MKFPVNSLLAGNFGFRDEFARDCLLQGGVSCEPDFLDHNGPRRWIRSSRAKANGPRVH